MASVESTTTPKCANCQKEQQSESEPLQRCSRCRTTLYCSKDCQAADWKPHKRTCGKPARPTNVVLLSLEKTAWFDDMYKSFLNDIKGAASVQEITTEAAATEFLTGANHHIPVIAADAALARKKSTQLRAEAVRFVQDGGIIIFGCDVPSFTTPRELEKLFAAFSLPWKTGDYHRTEFNANKAAQHVNTSGLVPRYSQKALHLGNVEKKDAVYLPTQSSRIQSHVFPPSRIEDLTQTPAAFRVCGKGWIGYTGDVNAEEETNKVVLAMCGLVE